jgi:EmrB/QacA subfamily drug resistance transporter
MSAIENSLGEDNLPTVGAMDGGKKTVRFRLTVLGLLLATCLTGLDNNIVNTALPRIATEFREVGHLSWIITSFMMGQCVVMPVYGKLSDLYGRKRLFVVAIVLFLIGSALCGFSKSILELAGFRAVQGLGASGIMTLSSTVVADLVEPKERGRYLGMFMGMLAASSLAGPLVGGAITSWLNWRWVFYVNIPLGGLVLILLAATLPGRIDRAGTAPAPKIDYSGGLLIVAAAACLMLTLSLGGVTYGWGSTPIVGLGVMFLVFSAFLAWQERRAAEPILSPRLLSNRVLLACMATSVLVAFPFFGAVVFMPLYFQLVLGMNPAQSGLGMLPQIIGLVVSSNISGWLMRRGGSNTALIRLGVGGVAIGLLLIGVSMAAHRSLWELEAALLVLGLGGGMVRPNLIISAQSAVKEPDVGSATSTLVFVHTLAGTAGVSTAGAIMAGRLVGYVTPRLPRLNAHAILSSGLDQIAALPALERGVVLDGYAAAISSTFLISGLIALASILVASRIPRMASSHG